MKKHFGKLVFTALLLAISVGAQVQHSIKITWNTYVQGSDLATGFNVYRATVTGGPYTKLNAAPLPVSSTSYTDTSGVGGTKYFYVVTSVDAAGFDSAFSAEANATFLVNPAVPQGVIATSQ